MLSGYRDTNEIFLGIFLPPLLCYSLEQCSLEREMFLNIQISSHGNLKITVPYTSPQVILAWHTVIWLSFIFLPIEQVVKRTPGQPLKIFLKFLGWLLKFPSSPSPETQINSVSHEVLSCFCSIRVRRFHPSGEIFLRCSVGLNICIVRSFYHWLH